MRIPTLSVALALLTTACAAPAETTIHLSTAGNDTGDGSAAQPVRSLNRAKELVREAKAQGAVTVELAAGTYELAETFTLGQEDSGSAAAPVVWQAAPGAEVRFVGGRVVKGFQKVTDGAVLARLPVAAHDHVLVSDLKAQGVADYGEITQRGMGLPIRQAHMELFWRDQPMTLARYPNDDFLNIKGLPDGQDGLRFGYDDDHPMRWAATEPDAWVFGYWYHDWADTTMKVASIDADAMVVTQAPPKHGYGLRDKQRFYFFNVLAELDSPGEYYVDRQAGKLYFWPPEPLRDGDAQVSVLPELVRIDDAEHIDLKGIIFETTRATAVVITGRHHLRLVGCTIRNTGNKAVQLSGADNGVIGCDIYETGDGGISLSGGDRTTLTPARLTAENNHIHDYSRWCRTYRAAVSVGGVGNIVRHNLIHDGPHNAIQLSGNDHLIEYNELHSVCYETGDVGAFYMGRDWTARGTTIRYNYFHDIQGPGRIGAMGVYLDDQASGINIVGNVFYKVTRAMFIGGGDDNLVDGNLFVDCVPAMHLDNRGMGWQKTATDDPKGTLRTRLTEVPYDRGPYLKYPNLAKVLDDDPGVPKRNTIVHNVSYGGKWDDIHRGTRDLQTVESNLVDEDPLFQHPERLADGQHPQAVDFALQPGSPAFGVGFKPLPLESIGLVQNADRASWPPRHAVRPPARRVVEELPVQNPKPAGPKPVYKPQRVALKPVPDGTLTAEEWAGADPKNAVRIAENLQGTPVEPVSLGWVLYDETTLWVAFDNGVKSLKQGNTWGQHDAVEIAIRDLTATKQPIVVLRGYPTGQFTVQAEEGDLKLKPAKLGEGVKYGAEVVSPTRWTAEWQIPWAALGIDPGKQPKLAFNLTVRKTADDLWQMWRSTRAHSYDVDLAGILELGG